MLKDVNTEAASSASDTGCPHCGPDTYTCPVQPARDTQVGVGVEAESYDRDSQMPQSRDAESLYYANKGKRGAACSASTSTAKIRLRNRSSRQCLGFRVSRTKRKEKRNDENK